MEGRFQIVGEIGSGQYSTVYKALDSVSGDVVALKKVRMFDSRVGLPLSFYNEVKALELEGPEMAAALVEKTEQVQEAKAEVVMNPSLLMTS